MKKFLVTMLVLISFQANASCEDMEGVGAISLSLTSPSFLTTFLATGDDPTVNCKMVRELRVDAQKALVDGNFSERLIAIMEKMKANRETSALSTDEMLNMIIESTTEAN